MKAKLGMSPIAWWNDDLVELSDDVSLEECLRQSRSAGFTGMEMGRRFPNDPKVMLPILKEADVTLCGGWFSGTLVDEEMARNKDRIQPMIDLFKAVNAPCIVYGEVGRSIQGDRSKPLATKPKLSGDEMKAYGRRLTEFGEWCAEQGMPLSYHHHMGRSSRPSRSSMPSCAIPAKAFRCCSTPATSPLPAATCCAPSTTTTSASTTSM